MVTLGHLSFLTPVRLSSAALDCTSDASFAGRKYVDGGLSAFHARNRMNAHRHTPNCLRLASPFSDTQRGLGFRRRHNAGGRLEPGDLTEIR